MRYLPPPYTLRLMQMEDVPAVLEIERAVQSSPWKASSFAHEIVSNPQSRAVVLTAESEVVGYMVFWLVAGDLQVHNIAIAQDWRGRGLGAALLLNSLLWGCDEGAELATLEVRRSNTAAQALYRRYGFAIVGERRGYYRDNQEDALLMTAAPLDEAYEARMTAAWERLEQHLQQVYI